MSPENPVMAVVMPCGVIPGAESAQFEPAIQAGPAKSSYVDAEKLVFSNVAEGLARIVGHWPAKRMLVVPSVKPVNPAPLTIRAYR